MLCVIVSLSSFGCAAQGYTVYPATAVFSGDIMFSAKLFGGRADYAYRRMLSVINDIDKEASTTRADGDLYKFNAACAGERVEVGKHCYELFSLGLEYYETTSGAFNCAALPLSKLWKLDAASVVEPGSYVDCESLPSREAVEETSAYCIPTLVSASTEDGKYYLTKSDGRVKLDFGGIAKGYAADECAKVLSEYGVTSALLDISGNAYFYGDYFGGGSDKGSAWHVGVVSPRPRAGETLSARGTVAAVDISANSAAVTSGDYMRYYVSDIGGSKVYFPHIIGKSGVPLGVEFDGASGNWKNSAEYVISSTVIGGSGAACDVLSTAVAALGMEDGARLLQKVGGKGLIFTEKRYTIVGDVEMYKPDVYDGFEAYEFYDCELG